MAKEDLKKVGLTRRDVTFGDDVTPPGVEILHVRFDPEKKDFYVLLPEDITELCRHDPGFLAAMRAAVQDTLDRFKPS